MGSRKKMELPLRRYSVPETIMRKYWMGRQKEKTMVDKSAQTEWRPCVVWTSSSLGRSASEPSLCGTGTGEGGCRPITAPSTPTWTSSTLPPPTTTSAPTSSTSTSLPSTDQGRRAPHSPRPPPSVQVLCIHHDVSKADVMLQVPEPSDSSFEDPPNFMDVGVNTVSPGHESPDLYRDMAVQTGSPPPLSPEHPLNKFCQTNFTPLTTPNIESLKKLKSDFSCQIGDSLILSKPNKLEPIKKKIETDSVIKMVEKKSRKISNKKVHKSKSCEELPIFQNQSEQLKQESLKKNMTEAAVTNSNYNEYPGSEMVIPRYSAFPRTGSMVVNMSSVDNSSDSDLSLTDSLEDPGHPPPEPIHLQNKMDNRLVRGEVSQAVKQQRSIIKSKNTYAYFLFLSGEEDSIREHKVPDKIKARLRKREEEIKKVVGMKLRKIPNVNYRRRRRIYKVVNKDETHSSILHKSPVRMYPFKQIDQTKKPIRTENYFCECQESNKGRGLINLYQKKSLNNNEQSPSKNLEQSQKFVDEVSKTGEKSITSTISKGKSASHISLTLTVPNQEKVNNDLTLDEKVAKVLLESLEEIREQTQQTKKEKTFENLDFNKNTPSARSDKGKTKSFLSKATSISDEFLNNIGNVTSKAVSPIEVKSPTKDQPTYEDKYTSPINGESSNVRDKVVQTVPLEELNETESKKSQGPKYTSFQQMSLKMSESLPGPSSDVTSDRQTMGQVEDEELLRAILKKSLQPQQGQSGFAIKESHSEVCELGLKYLSNEIDIDQFIAGIPLERIEQDVKRLMYKHFLGTKPPVKENNTFENLMKTQMVVSFRDSKDEKKEKISKCHCGKSFDDLNDESHVCQPKKLNVATQIEDDQSSNNNSQSSPEIPEKLEKCVSPMDKSVATAVQTLDSFLDSERLPVEAENIINSKTMITHMDGCKYVQSKGVNTELCFCKGVIAESSIPNPDKEVPNNHSSLSQNSFYSPRPVKSLIKNNLQSKAKGRSDEMSYRSELGNIPEQEETFTGSKGRKKEIIKDLPKKYSNEMHMSKKFTDSHSSDFKIADAKGVISKNTKNFGDMRPEKRSKTNIQNKRGNKFTQMFEVIPEERTTPVDTNAELIGRDRVPKNRSGNARGPAYDRYQNKGTKQDPGELTSKKTVSTMVNFEQEKLDELRKSEAKSKQSKSTGQNKHKEKYTESKQQKTRKEDTQSREQDRKSVVVGRFRPDKQEKEEQSTPYKGSHTKSKVRPPPESDEILNLSKGWIDFYLLPENKDISEIGVRDFPKNEEMMYKQSESHSKKGSHQKGGHSSKKGPLPTLSSHDQRKGYKSSSDCSNVSLPEIRSSSSSTPSSPEEMTRRGTRRQGIDMLPQLHEGYTAANKKRISYYSEGDMVPSDHRATRRVEVSHSEHSVSSVMSSTVVMSESPGDEEHSQLKLPEKRSRRSSRASQHQTTTSGSCWTVTVAGGDGIQPPPDVEMRLCFAGTREKENEPRKELGRYTAPTAIRSNNETEEEKPSSGRSISRQYYIPPDSVVTSLEKRERMASRNVQRMYLEDDYRLQRMRKDACDEDWGSEGVSEGSLHVTGSAITPEEKPRVPTQSERDLVRSHRYRFTR